MKPTANVNLTQEEANLLLKVLESYEGVDDFKDYDVEKAISQIWNKILDSGLKAGFGKAKWTNPIDLGPWIK